MHALETIKRLNDEAVERHKRDTALDRQEKASAEVENDYLRTRLDMANATLDRIARLFENLQAASERDGNLALDSDEGSYHDGRRDAFAAAVTIVRDAI